MELHHGANFAKGGRESIHLSRVESGEPLPIVYRQEEPTSRINHCQQKSANKVIYFHVDTLYVETKRVTRINYAVFITPGV